MVLSVNDAARSILEVEHLSKHFGALAAVNDLSFSVNGGETFGITGPNGAGKTALFDVIAGQSRATTGVVRLKGEEIQRLTSNRVCQRGIARTFQIAAVMPSQTVLGTILAGLHFGAGRRGLAAFRFSSQEIDRAYELAVMMDLESRLGVRTELLSVFECKRLMIAAAFATSPSILMLDEPVGGLTEAEGRQLMGYVEQIKTTGVTIMLVEHVMSVLMKISDRVMIMNQGGKIFEGTPAEAIEHPDVIRLYLGSARVAGHPGQGGDHAQGL